LTLITWHTVPKLFASALLKIHNNYSQYSTLQAITSKHKHALKQTQ